MTKNVYFNPALILFGKSVVIESTPKSLKWRAVSISFMVQQEEKFHHCSWLFKVTLTTDSFFFASTRHCFWSEKLTSIWVGVSREMARWSVISPSLAIHLIKDQIPLGRLYKITVLGSIKCTQATSLVYL
mgnify:CR=1 FL=1